VRHGPGKGSVTLGGRRVPVTRPRARTVDRHEVPLTSYEYFAAEDVLTQVVMERMLVGVATRRHARTSEPIGETLSGTQKSVSKSAISRRFIKQTETALAELMARDLAELDIKVLMLDGVQMAERCVVVGLAITADGTKKPVGLWDGSTENKTVVRSLLADLVARGLVFDDGLLVVIDGAKALSAAVRDVFGDKALIQRCTLHKRRNVAEHLPDKDRDWVDAKLAKAFGHPDPEAGLQNAKSLAAQLAKSYPSAAASLREGLDEMFTVSRIGIDGALAMTLTTSNPIESMISIARTTNRNVTRWRDGQMVLRWTAAGMLNAERSFRSVKGYKQMPQLVAALKRHAHPGTEPSDTAA
jgi:transposase-like protein